MDRTPHGSSQKNLVGPALGDADGVEVVGLVLGMAVDGLCDVVGLVLGRNVDGLCDGLADGLPVGAVGRPVGAYDGGGT